MASEDALVTAHYGVHYSYGMQYGAGPKPFAYVQSFAEPKHFFAYDLEGSGPNTDSKIPAYHASCTTGGSVHGVYPCCREP